MDRKPGEPDSDPHGDDSQKGLSGDEATHLWREFRVGRQPGARYALDRLYRALRHPLIDFCKRRGCDYEQADEITEAAFIRLFIRRSPARKGFIPLLRKTAQNLLRDAQRRALRQPEPASTPPPSDPSKAAIEAETVRAVRDCLDTLEPEDRALVICHHVDGLTQRAACELLGLSMSPAGLTARLRRARERLGRCLKKKMTF